MKNSLQFLLFVTISFHAESLYGQRHVFSNHATLLENARDSSLAFLHRAIDRASNLEEPGEGYILIAEACIADREPSVVLQLISQMSERLKTHVETQDEYSPTPSEAFLKFAQCVAPISHEERDVHLRSLLWCLNRYQKNGLKVLTMDDSFRVARIILGLEANNTALKPSPLLLRLDPNLYIKALNDRVVESYRLLYREARELHMFVYHGPNNHSRTLLEYLVENGQQSNKVLSIYKHYNPLRAAETSKDFISYLAWTEPDIAIELASQVTDDFERFWVYIRIGRVLAYTNPERVEEVLVHIDNGLHRNAIRNTAAEESERRNQGKPPTLTPDAFCDQPRSVPRENIDISPEDREYEVENLEYIFHHGRSHLRPWVISNLLVFDYEKALRLIPELSEAGSTDDAFHKVLRRSLFGMDPNKIARLLEYIDDDMIFVESASALAKSMVARRYYIHKYKRSNYQSMLDEIKETQNKSVEPTR